MIQRIKEYRNEFVRSLMRSSNLTAKIKREFYSTFQTTFNID